MSQDETQNNAAIRLPENLPGLTAAQLADGVTKLVIVSIAPKTPIENQPIEIYFRISDSPIPRHGILIYDGLPKPGTDGSVRVDMEAGQVRSGVIHGMAPRAGEQVEITINFFGDNEGERQHTEHPAPRLAGTKNIDILAQYELTFEWFKVVNPRQGPDAPPAYPARDKVFATYTVHYGDEMVSPLNGPARLSPFSDPPGTFTLEYPYLQAGETAPVNLKWGTFTQIPGKGPDLVLDFVMTNIQYEASGKGTALQVLDWMSKVGQAIATVAYPQFSAGWAAADQLHQTFNNHAFDDCDGLVVVDRITMHSSVMADVAGRTTESVDEISGNDPHLQVVRHEYGIGYYAEERLYQGESSPAVCGEISHYIIRFSVGRRSMWT